MIQLLLLISGNTKYSYFKKDIIVVVVNKDHNDIAVVGNGGKEDFVDIIVVLLAFLKNTVKNN